MLPGVSPEFRRHYDVLSKKPLGRISEGPFIFFNGEAEIRTPNRSVSHSLGLMGQGLPIIPLGIFSLPSRIPLKKRLRTSQLSAYPFNPTIYCGSLVCL